MRDLLHRESLEGAVKWCREPSDLTGSPSEMDFQLNSCLIQFLEWMFGGVDVWRSGGLVEWWFGGVVVW